MPITYKPKIIPIRHGDCRQTIRKVGKKTICRGDVVTFHGWEGIPYRSKWSWRKEVIVFEVIPAEISLNGMFIEEIMHAWSSWYPARLAEYDYVEPATGEGLRDVLFDIYGVPDEPMKCLMIRW